MPGISWANWLLWWRVDRGAVDRQAARYDELKLASSFKGWSVIFILANAVLSALPALVNRDPAMAFTDPALLLVLAPFIYFGQRWAMIGAMLVWTLEKLAQLDGDPRLVLVVLPWWAVFLHAFYMALLVERRRADPGGELETLGKNLAVLLRHTGRLLQIAAGEIWAGLRLAIRKARR